MTSAKHRLSHYLVFGYKYVRRMYGWYVSNLQHSKHCYCPFLFHFFL
ncbi:hypothetical protein MtrunA17_Chr4g0005271 [Medicago truncatula]|uniref:Uncharacterized protein n=1 Tax=Medicago truncatula TaxID=3880 RepID=A0A396HZD9_MEDTR|nr:hypothetical protein MtrunA17_Chr4g0005271 [Medicago truncatula]